MPEMSHGQGRTEHAEGGGRPDDGDLRGEGGSERAPAEPEQVAGGASRADEAAPSSQPGAPVHAPRTRTSAAFKALMAGAIVLVLLLIFILENTQSVEVSYFGASGRLALGVALLLAAVGGAVLVGVLAVARIAQVRRHTRRQARGRRPAGP